jgi:hypothetical protein
MTVDRGGTDLPELHDPYAYDGTDQSTQIPPPADSGFIPNVNSNIDIEGYNLPGSSWLLKQSVDPASFDGFVSMGQIPGGYDTYLVVRTIQFDGIDTSAGVLLVMSSGVVNGILMRVESSDRSYDSLIDYYSSRYGTPGWSYGSPTAEWIKSADWMDGEGDALDVVDMGAYSYIIYAAGAMPLWDHKDTLPLWMSEAK